MTAGLLFVAGLAIIAGLWATGHPAIIDRGEGQPRPRWDEHSWGHLSGAFFVSGMLGALASSAWFGFIAAMVLWGLVEVAQAFPRDGQGGFADPLDLTWDAVGAAVGALLVALLL